MKNNKLDIFIDQKRLPIWFLDRKKYNFYTILDSEKVYDAAIFINTPHKKTKIKVKNGNVFCIIGEPPYKSNWLYGSGGLYLYKGLEQYDKVFASVKTGPNVLETQPFLGWFDEPKSKSYDELKLESKPLKIKMISAITSDKFTTKGHRLRHDFIQELKRQNLNIDYFGRGSNELEKKSSGLKDYKYSIAIENGSFKNYFSEKIMDCFINYTVPIYFGCENISDYFPENSYILIDINNPEQSILKIIDIIKNDNYEKRLDALKEARCLVLDEYNMYNLIESLESEIINNLKNKDKDYVVKPILSISHVIKIYLFPKFKWLRNYVYNKIYGKSL